MAYQVDLSGAWAKFKRAQSHVAQLRGEIEQEGAPDPRVVPLRLEYDDVDRAFVYRIEHAMQVREHWPLLVGDAVHNFRCALDHLAWQLAMKFLDGGEPSGGLAKRIQFPIVSDSTKWPGNLSHWLRQEDIDSLALFQPMEPYYRQQPGRNHGLEGLAFLSNRDKHRKLHLLQVVPEGLSVTNQAFVDCVPDPRPTPEGSLASVIVSPIDQILESGREVLRVFIVPTGPDPHVDFAPRLFCYVAVHQPTWEVLGMLNSMRKGIGAILSSFDIPSCGASKTI